MYFQRYTFETFAVYYKHKFEEKNVLQVSCHLMFSNKMTHLMRKNGQNSQKI